MNDYRNHVLAVASLSLGLLMAAPARAATVQKVSSWGASGVPSYVTMYIYVPDKLATKPPVMVACHSCGTPVSGYVNSIKGIMSAADKNGFVLILPEATGRNCWDVGSAKSLTRDGGSDAQAITQMVKYALTTYGGDPTRVYAMGGSSGAMMTQALMAVYPDVFKAGSARAGVPAGCWADGFDAGQQWSNNCAGGNTNKTGQGWGDAVRAMYPGYSGHRPRIQIFHGTADTTISYKNFAESIEEWTNVLGLPATPTSKDNTKTSVATYDRQFWQNDCGYTVLEAWAGQDGKHAMEYEQDSILKFFGLDKAGGPDPEDAACSGDPGAGGSGGSSGAVGASGASGSIGSSGSSSAGSAGRSGSLGSAGRSGSTTSSSGSSDSSGKVGTPGASGRPTATDGGAGSSAKPSVGGAGGSAGTVAPNQGAQAGVGSSKAQVTSVSGSTSSSATTTTSGKSGNTPVSAPAAPSDSGDGGCSLIARDGQTRSGVFASIAAILLGLALRRRQR